MKERIRHSHTEMQPHGLFPSVTHNFLSWADILTSHTSWDSQSGLPASRRCGGGGPKLADCFSGSASRGRLLFVAVCHTLLCPWAWEGILTQASHISQEPDG